jgi:hypothetical protein
MLGLGWLALRQAQDALQTGRLEEAQRLLTQPSVQGYKRAGELLQQLHRAFVERAEQHLRRDNPAAAWTDLLRAEQLGLANPAAGQLRQALTRLGLAEVRALLEAGEPARAVEVIAQLRDRVVRQPELEPLEEAAKAWVEGGDRADAGSFALALQALERVSRRLVQPPAALERFRQSLVVRQENFSLLLGQLHTAAQQERWADVVQLCEQVLAVAPQHTEARRLRSRAWKALEPATVVTGPSAAAAPEPLPLPSSQRPLLLWVDGVGGYLVCLGNRVTIGQGGPDACVDIALYADVSRLHAALTRDTEGYLLEALRPVQVNGRPVERALLHSGDRLTLGASCQLQFRQPVPVSASARLDLVSGHRLRLAVDGILLMADTLVLGPEPQAHIVLPETAAPVILYRQKEALAIRRAGAFVMNGRACKDRCTLEPGCTITGEDFSLTLEPVDLLASGRRISIGG